MSPIMADQVISPHHLPCHLADICEKGHNSHNSYTGRGAMGGPRGEIVTSPVYVEIPAHLQVKASRTFTSQV